MTVKVMYNGDERPYHPFPKASKERLPTNHQLKWLHNEQIYANYDERNACIIWWSSEELEEWYWYDAYTIHGQARPFPKGKERKPTDFNLNWLKAHPEYTQFEEKTGRTFWHTLDNNDCFYWFDAYTTDAEMNEYAL